MSKTNLHIKVDIHHRTANGGTYIARYRIKGSDGPHTRYLEGYGNSVPEALADLAKVIGKHPEAQGERMEV